MDKKRLLLVEDESSLAELYATELSLAGFEIVLASDGSVAWEKISGGENYDFLLIDLMMPNMGGIALLKKISEDAALAKIPRFVFSNYNQPELVKQAFDLGVADYFLKYQITPSEIAEKIKTYFQGSGWKPNG